MRLGTCAAIALCAVLLAPAAGAAKVSCARGGLQRAVDHLLQASFRSGGRPNGQ